jgi:recombination protein RecT
MPKPDAAAVVRSRTQAPPTGKDIATILQDQRPLLQRLAGRVLDADRLIAVALWSLRTTPQLAACTPDSLLACVEYAARVGLLPGPEGYLYFVPFFNAKRGHLEAQPIIGYRGLWELGRRSGYLLRAWADAVWPGDRYRILRGTQPVLEHEPDYTAPRTDHPLLVYSVVVLADGTTDFDVLPWADVERIRARSRAKDTGPWVTDTIEMALKTVVRHHSKRWRLTPDAAWGIAVADSAEFGTDTDREVMQAWAALSEPERAPASADATPPADATLPPPAAPEAPASEPEPPASDTAPTVEAVQAAGKAARAAGVPDDALREVIRAVVGSRPPAEWSPAERRTLHERLTGLVATLQAPPAPEDKP